MFKTKLPYTVLAIALASTLTACGGSGGGENGNGGGNVPAPSITLTNPNIDLQEAGEATISFSIANAGASAVVSASSNSEYVNVDVKNNTLNVTTKSVENDTLAQISIEVKYGGQRGQSKLNLNVINTSIISAYHEADALISLLDANYQDEKQLFDYASQIGYLSGMVTRSKVDDISARFHSSLSKINSGQNIATSLSTAITSYNASTTTETAFRAKLSALATQYNQSLVDSNKIANELFAEVGLPFSELNLTGNVFEGNVLQFSQLLTDTTGLFNGNEWEFNNHFKFLEDVLPSFNIGQLCLANDQGA
jgi:hypothetical protein